MSNIFSCVGTVARDAEVRYLQSGAAILTVTIANNVGFGDKQKTNWVRCNVWGKRAEGKLVDYLKKGTQVFVSGELTLNEYQANDGTTKSNLELNATILDLVGSKKEGGQAPQQAPMAKPAPANDLPYDDFDQDIPF
jgi:single-strand DNA-binding protein